jgi:hypothetical protein
MSNSDTQPVTELVWDTPLAPEAAAPEAAVSALDHVTAPPEPSTTEYPTHVDCRATLNELSRGMKKTVSTVIREGIEVKENKEVKKQAREIAFDMRVATMKHLRARGEFFRVGFTSYYLDRADNILIEVSKDSPDLKHLLWQLGYVPKNDYTPAILESVVDVAARAPMRPHHRIAHLAKNALYIYAGLNRMLKVTTDSITEVLIGTDDVILIANDLASWSALNDLTPLMDEIRPTLGNTCTQVRPDLALSKHLTARWSTESPLLPEQAHQLCITRFLFLFAASRYSLWPSMSLTGDQGSGKSTLSELTLTLLRNDPKALLKSLPGKEDGLIATLSNSSLCAFDNLDGARLDDPQRSTISDTICHLATGVEVPMRKLYSTNEEITFKIQNHGFFSARVDPFASRIDVHRRTITLTMDPADPTTTIAKRKLRENIHEARPLILAEILLRCQNMVRAHQAYGHKVYRGVTDMLDYEEFTLLCAEYEGTLPETRTLWEAQRRTYNDAITSANPLVYALRIWLGKPGNAERQVSPTSLFGELESIFHGTKSFSFRSPTQFGKHLGNNLPALRVLGFEKVPTRGSHGYKFVPTPAELERCQQEYTDFQATVTSRAISALKREAHMTDDDLGTLYDEPAKKSYKH